MGEYDSLISLLVNTAMPAMVTGFGGWFFARRKYNSEVDNSIIENMQKALDFYRKLSDDTQTRLDNVLKLNEKQSNEISMLCNKVSDLALFICMDKKCSKRIKSIDGKEIV